MNWVGLHTRSDRENLCGFSVLWNGFEKGHGKNCIFFENVGPKLVFLCVYLFFISVNLEGWKWHWKLENYCFIMK